MANKCSNCGSVYEYSPNDKALKCNQCGDIKNINTNTPMLSHPYQEQIKQDNSWAKEVRVEKCNNCGAEVALNQYEIIKKCAYCGGTSLESLKDYNAQAPDIIIPFAFDKVSAVNYFKEGLKKKWFVPNILKSKAPKYNLTGNYLGAYIFNGKADIGYSGVLEYDVIKTTKEGKRQTYSYTRNVSGKLEQQFFDWMYECSANLTQYDLQKIMPYYLQDKKPYSSEYLFGYMAEYFNTTVQQVNINFTEDLKNMANGMILKKHECDRIRTLNLNINYPQKQYQYCLLPCYIFSIDYKNKKYKTILNGQTGKLGGGVPRSPVKISFFVLAILAILAGIILLCI